MANQQPRFKRTIALVGIIILTFSSAAISAPPSTVLEAIAKGKVELEQGRCEAGLLTLREAAAKAETGRKRDLAEALAELGLAESASGNMKAALANLERAERIESSLRPRRVVELAVVTINLGGNLALQGRHGEGIAMLRRGIPLAEESWGPDNKRLAAARTQLGVAYIAAGRMDDALKQLRLARRIYAKQKPGADLANAYANEASALYRRAKASGDSEGAAQAGVLYSKAMAVAHDTMKEDDLAMPRLLQLYAEYLRAEGDPQAERFERLAGQLMAKNSQNGPRGDCSRITVHAK